MSAFHKLRVSRIEPLTADACSVHFEVPVELRASYAFHPGQHLTLRRDSGTVNSRDSGKLDGRDSGTVNSRDSGISEDRRTYSICSTPDELATRAELRIGVKRINDGLFSGWLTGSRPGDGLAAGDLVEVLTPAGRFGLADRDQASNGTGRNLGCLAAGSGITPMMSIIGTVLREEPDSQVTLAYGNRTSNDVMFLEELADLKNRYPERFTLLHVLSGEPQLSDLLTGRIDAEKVASLLAGPGAGVQAWYLCGPFGMVSAARDALTTGGVAESAVHAELFYVGDAPVEPADDGPAGAADGEQLSQVTVTLAGRTSTVQVGYRGTSILDAVLASRPDAPYACKGGVCGTCRARVTGGEVRMTRNYALEPDEIEAGLVLACQSHPVTAEVSLQFQ